jgi:uncharacterized protein GlcG (DUF336 family)
MPGTATLRLHELEDRSPVSSLIPGGTVTLTGGTLTYTGTAGNDHVLIRYDGGLITVTDQSGLLGRFAPASVTNIAVSTGAGNDLIKIASDVTQPATIDGGTGNDILQAGGGPTKIVGGTGKNILAGGSGSNQLVGGPNSDLLVGGSGSTTVTPGGGADKVVRVTPADPVAATPTTRVLVNNPGPIPGDPPQQVLTTAEVATLLRRAAAASSSNDAIIAVVDRNGRILGVRTEAGVAPAVMNNVYTRVFAIDGAVSLARTGAFFGNNQAPLTSRTVSNLSQSTITQREVESNPDFPDPNSTQRGPGFVAPVRIGAHFPPGVPNTPEVDLFEIEHTNRDASFSPGPDGIRGTADDIPLSGRFNINPAFVPPGQTLFTPDSYGFVTRALGPTSAANDIFQNRGIATLPGGIPLFKNGQVVGGIGVFFPGKTGYAIEENSSLSSTFDPTKPDRSLEAEWMAFAAAGGSAGPPFNLPIGAINGVPALPGFTEPGGRIDLVGVTLDIFGPGGFQGPRNLSILGSQLGVGNPDSGTNQPVDATGVRLLGGLPVPEGWLVTPHNGVGVTAAQVNQIIQDGILQADRTRAAIRLPASSGVRMVFAVTDRTGQVLGLYRMPDATVFSIDVAVAKARNTAYYADPSKLQPSDQVPGVPRGTAFTNRTFRYLALPRFPSAAQEGSAPPGPFSILFDGGANPLTGRLVGTPKPPSAYQTALGHDSFFPGTNFRDPTNPANQNGVVWFPGSSPLYQAGSGVIGGFGVSGDGVDQDDVVTTGGQVGFTPVGVLRADQTFFLGVRLPYQKYDRNPEAF